MSSKCNKLNLHKNSQGLTCYIGYEKITSLSAFLV